MCAAELDQYGGSLNRKCAGGPRAHFYTEKIGNQWYFCTPKGNTFWQVAMFNVQFIDGTVWDGTNHLQVIEKKYAGVPPTPSARFNWTYYTMLRLKSWGFNSVDMFRYIVSEPWRPHHYWPGDDTIPLDAKIPHIIAPNIGFYAGYNLNNLASGPMKNLIYSIPSTTYKGWRGGEIFDYFDKTWPEYLDNYWKKNPPPMKYSDYVLGLEVDEADHLWWVGGGADWKDPESGPRFETAQPGKHGTHAGWASLVVAPTQTANYDGRIRSGVNTRVVFPDNKVYTKLTFAAWLNWRHGTIANLNARWGSAYTTFGSTGAAVTGESLGTADAVTRTFSKTLTRPSRYSLQVYVGGVLKCGDDPNNQDPSTGNLICVDGSTGTLNYDTGTLSVTFPIAPTGSLSVNYISCGFGCGTGLLDEDGSHIWVPRPYNGNHLKGGTPTLRSDLDDWLYQFSHRYFSTVRAAHDKHWPGYLYLGPGVVGGWRTPPRQQVLQAASRYLDVIRIADVNHTLPDARARLDFYARYGGDKPWTVYMGVRANPDSIFAGDTRAICANTTVRTQAERGQYYYDWVQSFFQPTSDGVKHIAGLSFWSLLDKNAECANFGWLSYRDNAYDGREAVVPAGKDPWGFSVGGERGYYGDFVTRATQANKIWLTAAP
jgi:hypothetical protein